MFYIGQIQEKGPGCTLKKSLLSCMMILLTCTFAFWNIWFPRRPKCQMYYSKKEIGKTRSSCGWTFGVGGKLAGAFTFWNTNVFVGNKREAATVVVLLVWEASLVLLQQINHGMWSAVLLHQLENKSFLAGKYKYFNLKTSFGSYQVVICFSKWPRTPWQGQDRNAENSQNEIISPQYYSWKVDSIAVSVFADISFDFNKYQQIQLTIKDFAAVLQRGNAKPHNNCTSCFQNIEFKSFPVSVGVKY